MTTDFGPGMKAPGFKYFSPALVGLLVLPACGGADNDVPETATELHKKPVVVVPAALGTIRDSISLSGEIKPIADTVLSAGGQGGLVEAVLVREGDRVKKGQLLARISAGVAKANLKQAEAQYLSAKSTHDRIKALADKNMASAAQLEQAAAGLAGADAAVAMAKVSFAGAFLTAPHAGKVVSVNIDRGEMAPPGQPAIRIADISKVKVLAQLPERDVPLITVGREAKVSVDAIKDYAVVGKVSHVGIIAAQYSRTFDLEVEVQNPNERLRPGMLARVGIDRQVVENTLLTRRDAVIEGINERHVFVAKNGVARLRQVDVGPEDGTYVALSSGVDAGEEIIVMGHRGLVDGQPIKITDNRAVVPKNVAKAPEQEAPTRIKQ